MNIKHLIFAIAIMVVAALIFSSINKDADKKSDSSEQEEYKTADAILNAGEDAFTMSYKHTVPGEYSEIYVSATSEPGDEVTVKLEGPNEGDVNTKTLTADDNGQAYFTFRIYEYGEYSAMTNYNYGKSNYWQGITVK